MELYRRKQENDQDTSIDANTLAITTKSKTETKYLDANITQVGLASPSSLQIANLVVGKLYLIELKLRCELPQVRFTRFTATNNGIQIANMSVGIGNSGYTTIAKSAYTSGKFIAGAPTVSIEVYHGVANTGAPGSGNTLGNPYPNGAHGTWVRITEIDDDEENVVGIY